MITKEKEDAMDLEYSNRWAAQAYRCNMWRDRALPFAQVLLIRLRALKGRFFSGCGFYYSWEPYLLATLDMLEMPFPPNSYVVWQELVIRIRLNYSARCVADAEKEAASGTIFAHEHSEYIRKKKGECNGS